MKLTTKDENDFLPKKITGLKSAIREYQFFKFFLKKENHWL